MTARATVLGATNREQNPAFRLPAIVEIKIGQFLEAGYTGKIILNVKNGEVRSCEMTEMIDARVVLDRTFDLMQD